MSEHERMPYSADVHDSGPVLMLPEDANFGDKWFSFVRGKEQFDIAREEAREAGLRLIAFADGAP